MPFLLLALPALLAVLALRTDAVPLKVSVAFVDGLVVLLGLFVLPDPRPSSLIVAAALGVSSVGDWFLATRGTRTARFAAGIGAFLLAHVGFLVFALLHGGIDWPVLAVLVTGYAAFFFFGVRPRMPNRRFSFAVLAYMLASCATMAAAIGMGLPAVPKLLFVSGIALIMLSDTIIALREFLGRKKAGWLILPTYYLSHLAIVSSMLAWGLGGTQFR